MVGSPCTQEHVRPFIAVDIPHGNPHPPRGDVSTRFFTDIRELEATVVSIQHGAGHLLIVRASCTAVDEEQIPITILVIVDDGHTPRVGFEHIRPLRISSSDRFCQTGGCGSVSKTGPLRR
ncbi:uncharacterized protein METZ01_LOCUS276358 [marine metagenome]|uniref:Uncharacterized protein n=1 Tax=marine metagenome TaxID=408172 RepID=A0A382KES6_9ZZZZ